MSSKLKLTKVRRFQSIESADVELGGLTVIVGPSNSGKSAYGRALRALARNTQGSGHVTEGHKTAIVIATTDDGHTIGLERGTGTSAYRVITPEGKEEHYTKAGTSVPEDIKALLKLPESSPDAHFTTQFDGPYLLDQNGTTTQRVLGELTNVTTLAEAAREANRRRLECTREANLRRKDAELAADKVKADHGTLPKRKRATEEARSLLDELTEDASLAQRLETYAGQVTTARKAAKLQRKKADKLAKALDGADEAAKLLEGAIATPTELIALAERSNKAKRVAATQRLAAKDEGKRADECETELEQSLDRLGLCPLCGTKRG